MPNTGTPLVGHNPDYDPALRFKPVPAGTYYCRVKMSDPDPSTRWTKAVDNNGGDYYYGKPVVEILDGDHTGRKVYGFLSTMMNDQGGSGAHDVIIAAGLSHKLADIATHEELYALVDEALAGDGAEMNVYIDWNAALKLLDSTWDYKDRIKGVKHFPKDEDGNPLHTFPKYDADDNLVGNYAAQAEAKYFRAA